MITVWPKLVSKKSHVGCDEQSGDCGPMKEEMPKRRRCPRGGSYNVPELQPGEYAAKIQDPAVSGLRTQV